MSDAAVSIIDSSPRQSKAYDPKSRRHPVCRQLDLLLESIIVHQDTGNSNVGEALRHEFGESLFTCLMQAAGIRRMRHHGTQKATGAPAEIGDPLGR